MRFALATTPSSFRERWRTARALRRLGADQRRVEPHLREALDRDGFVVIPGVVPDKEVAAMRSVIGALLNDMNKRGKTVDEEAQCYLTTEETLVKDVINKDPVFARVIFDPQVLSLVALVLRNDLKLSYTHMRMPVPHQGRQAMHLDTYEADLVHPHHYFCNVIWMLSDFTSTNGATRFVPGSHRWDQLPNEVMADVRAAHSDEVLATGSAGTVIVFDGHIWHAGGENTDGTERPALFTSWVHRRRHQIDDQKALLTAATRESLSPAHLHLLGVS